MKIYDCFTFYNEFELLELRLKSLYDIVDYFVIVEADRTQNNTLKPYYFQEKKDQFKEYLPKIIHIKVKIDISYRGIGDWSIENTQRNSIMEGLKDSSPDDLIFISDLDEIPDPNIFQRLNENKIELIISYNIKLLGKALVCPAKLLVSAKEFLNHAPIVMAQNFHYYYFDWIANSTWQGSILTKRKNLTTPQELRNSRNNLPRVLKGGWHFSYMGGANRIIEKINSIVEGKAFLKSNSNLSDKKHIEDIISKGKDIYGRKGIPEEQFLSYDVNNIKLPYMKEFIKKYPYFLREPEKYLNDNK